MAESNWNRGAHLGNLGNQTFCAIASTVSPLAPKSAARNHGKLADGSVYVSRCRTNARDKAAARYRDSTTFACLFQFAVAP